MNAIFESRHDLAFSNRGAIPIAEIAHSLLALEKTMRVARGAFNALVFDGAVDRLEVELCRLETGSLLDTFLVRFFFKDQAQLDTFIQRLRERLKVDALMEKNPVIGATVMLIVAYGLFLAAQRFGTHENPIHIENSFNNSVLSAGDVLGLDPDTIRRKLSESVTAKDWLANRTAKLVRPARSDERATVRMDRFEPIPPEALMEVPLMTGEGSEDSIELLTNAEIRLDLDNRKRGWWAVLDSLGERRIRLQLDPSVNPHDLLRSDVVRVNAELLSSIDEDGEKHERLIYVREIVEEEPEQPVPTSTDDKVGG